jgi:hypothetical protein
MALVKATDFDALRKLLKQRGKDAEANFVQALSGEHAQMYKRVMAFDWNPIEEHAAFLTAAAEVLYPKHPQPVEQLGHDLAECIYSGIYRIFLRIPTVVYLISRAAAVWRTYYDTGEAKVENVADKSADLVIRGFPELPVAMRQATTGHVQVLLQRTGAKEVSVSHQDSDPDAWRWTTHWL